MNTSDFDYKLPEELIAQQPAPVRSASRMMVLHRDTGTIEHRHVTDLPEYLSANDLMVMNDTKVFPARLLGTWTDTHGLVELLLVEELRPFVWKAIGGSGRKMRPGQTATFAEGHIQATILERDGELCTVQIDTAGSDLMPLLQRYGLTPLPPYIHRENQQPLDSERYQTVYARNIGAVAAPTAGLHFDQPLLDTLSRKGIRRCCVTLHVGPGTFKPVKVDQIEDHVMDAERFHVPTGTAQAIVQAKAQGGRILAVGSTTVRTLETIGLGHSGDGSSRIFIHPPYAFNTVDILLTNFHLPRSTLIMMVSALAGRERILEAYRVAVQERYRFFSYGDCMLIL